MRHCMATTGASRAMVVMVITVLGTLGCAHPQPVGQGAAPSDDDGLRDQIVAHERAGMEALKVGDLATFAASIAEEAVFVDAQGPATKAEVVAHTAEFRLSTYAMADVRFIRLSRDAGLIAYTLTESGTSHSRTFSARVHVTSVWRERNGTWLCEFSQETLAR